MGERCRQHGGNARVGPAHPAWKHGARSKYLPARYVEAYEEALRDPNRVSLQHQIALLNAREVELIGRLSTTESGDAWRRLSELGGEVRAIIESIPESQLARDKEGLARAVNQLIAVLTGEMLPAIEAGLGDEAVWKDLYRQINLRRAVALVEHRSVQVGGEWVPIALMVGQQARFAMILSRYVEDPAKLSEAIREIEAEAARADEEAGYDAPAEGGKVLKGKF